MNKKIALILTTAISALLSEPSAIATKHSTTSTVPQLKFPTPINDGTTNWTYQKGYGYDTNMYVNRTVEDPHYTIGRSTSNSIDFHYSISKEVEAKPLLVTNTRWKRDSIDESKPRTTKENMHIRWRYNTNLDTLTEVPPTSHDKLTPNSEDKDQNRDNALAFIRAFHRAQS